MKSIATLLLLTQTNAFAPSHVTTRTTVPATYISGRPAPLSATLTADELSEMSKEEQLDVLGVKEEELALGIDADEVLQFIGTKQDLVEKFTTDLPKLSPTEIETEVSKYLMDGEMLDMTIKYYQRKAEDPTWEPQYQEEDNSPLAVFFRVFSQYAVWIAAGIILKDVVTNYFNKGGADAAM